MSQNYMKPGELKKLFHPDLQAIYEIETESLNADLRVNDIHTPVVLSKDGKKLIDGYRRTLAGEAVGIEEIPCIVSELEGTAADRVMLNQQRDKTWRDDRSDLLISFETFAKKQGQRLQAGYDRYKEIGIRTRCKYKDQKSLRQVEEILKFDTGDFPLSNWLLGKKADLKSVYSIMELMKEGKHPDIVKRVVSMWTPPKAALKQIEDLKKKIIKEKYVFTLPGKKSESVILHQGYEEEIMKMLNDNKADMLFYEPLNILPGIHKSSQSEFEHRRAVEAFAVQAANKVKPYTVKRMNEGGSLFIPVKEYYVDGISMRLVNEVINSVEQETGLFYKQTLIIAPVEDLTKPINANRLPDETIHLLWFVKSKKAKMERTLFLGKASSSVDEHAPEIYRQCSNFISRQSIPGVIRNFKEKGCVTDAATLMPILLSTKEDGLVVDLSMTGQLCSAATIMNRRYIGLVRELEKIEQEKQKNVEVLESFSDKHASQLLNIYAEDKFRNAENYA